jgi:predicted nuclease of predicted toxin-antitoxin system
MKFKLDENFRPKAADIFHEYGFDAETVNSEKLSGCTDLILHDRCRKEKRCLVTMDLDFSDVIRFPPEKSHGIVIIRMVKQVSSSGLENLIRQFLDHVKVETVGNRLWIVEPGRIRIHDSEK